MTPISPASAFLPCLFALARILSIIDVASKVCYKKPMDILIADDEPFIQRSLSFVLRKEGFEVETADDGQEALKKAKEYNPRVIFLDVMMPGINGFSVCSAIKSDAALKESYVIILTAKGQELDKATGLSAGANEFMTKPFSPREVVDKVRRIMNI